jgi:hypothetical protein
VQFMDPYLRIGDVVTVAFDSNSSRGVPVDPTVSKIRKDLSWEDLINEGKGVLVLFYYFKLVFNLFLS